MCVPSCALICRRWPGVSEGNSARGLLPPGCLMRLELREPACTIKRSLRCRRVRSSGRMQAAWWRVLAFPGSTLGRGSRWDPCSTSKHGPRIVWPSASFRPSSRQHVPLPPVGTLVLPGDLSACVNGSQLSHCCPVLCQGRCLLRPCPAIPLGFMHREKEEDHAFPRTRDPWLVRDLSIIPFGQSEGCGETAQALACRTGLPLVVSGISAADSTI